MLKRPSSINLFDGLLSNLFDPEAVLPDQVEVPGCEILCDFKS